MKRIILLFTLVTFYGCFQTEDDTNNNCTSNCTILKGRIITTDNQGISGVNLTFKYFKGAELSSSTRKISDINSDGNGYFYDEFYLKDNEIAEDSYGNFIFGINENSLNLRDDIITPNLVNIFLERYVYINHRDTVIEQTYYFPKKTYVVVNLNNFIPIQQNDRFEIQAMFPYGYENPEPDELNDILETIYLPTNGKFYRADEINNSLNVIVAQNEKNIIKVYKRKNGVYTYEQIVIDVNSSSPNEITIEY